VSASPGASAAGAPAAAPVALHDIDWHPVTGAVVWTTAAQRQPTVDEATATRILRCTARSFAMLRDLGLTPMETTAGPRYDANDIRNAALYSLSGKTEVEIAMRAVLSFLRGSDRDLFGERRWTYQMVPDEGGGDGDCLVHPVTPESFGGQTTGIRVGDRAPATDGLRLRVPSGMALSGAFISRGAPAPVRSGLIRTLAEDLIGSGVRWHYLPPEAKRDAHAALERGVGKCDTLSIVLAERLAGAGYEAAIYRGWIVGITKVPHSWIEVVDEDAQVKIVDPSLLVLAAHSSLGTPGFTDRALGARLAHIAPTRCLLAEPIGIDADTDAPRDIRFTCRPGTGPAGGPAGAR
jgi:hypothetical protein